MSRKKKRKNRTLEIVFWVVVAGGVLWLVWGPRPHRHNASHQVQVTEETEIPSIGDEQLQPGIPSGTAQLPPPEKPELPTTAFPHPAVAPPQSPIQVQGKPRIAIVIDDVGLDIAGSRRAQALPAFITLSYIPYSPHLRDQTKESREEGHELLLHMPMEPIGHADPGPGALLTSQSQDEMKQNMDTALASFTGFDGMNNHMGSRFTANREDMEVVISELQQRGLFFLDSRTSAQSVGADVAREHGLPTITRDVFLDDDMSPKAIRAQLEETERVARRKGYAVAIGHPHPATLQELEAWIPEAQRKGFVFVPINILVNRARP